MRAVWLGVPEHFLEERRRLGHDRGDEVWDGVLHMVPPPSSLHADVAFELAVALRPIARQRSLKVFTNETGLFDPDRGNENYRIPDAALVRLDQVSRRGLEGAELVIEVLSPHDESRDKFPFYAERGVREMWLLTPSTRAIEVHRLAGTAYERVPHASVLRSPLLEIELSIVEGKLRLRDGDYVADV